MSHRSDLPSFAESAARSYAELRYVAVDLGGTGRSWCVEDTLTGLVVEDNLFRSGATEGAARRNRDLS